MNEYLIWRLAKLLAVSLLVFGFGAVLAGTRRNRILGLQISSVGFGITWIAGYAMLANPREELGQAWIMWSILWSLVAMLLQALYAHGSKDRPYLGALAITALGGAFISMVLREESALYWLLAQLVLLLFSAWLFFSSRLESGSREQRLAVDANLDAIQSWNWFKWIARFEGLSIILLMLIYMPLKYAAGIVLDNDTGFIGWIHGVMFVLYTGSLLVVGIFLGWSWKRMVMGFLAAQVPIGSFVFEWNCHKKANVTTTDR